MRPDEETAADDATLMRRALAEADASAAAGEVPVGCVIAVDGVVIATGQNRRERDDDPTAHAEIVALRAAGAAQSSWRLAGATLYVTLEPCPMCAGAIVNARVPRLVFGCGDPKAGAAGTLMNLCTDGRLNHQLDVTPNVLTDDCAGRLKTFFRARRRQPEVPEATPGEAG